MQAEQAYYAPQDGAQMEPQQDVGVAEAAQLDGTAQDLGAMGAHMALPVAGAEGGEEYAMNPEQMQPQEPVTLQGPWEKKKIADLRAFLIQKGLDTTALDAVLNMAGDPVTRIHRTPKAERKRAAPEGAEGADGNPEKRRRAQAAPDPSIPPEVQNMSVTELRVRSQPRRDDSCAAMQPKANRTLLARCRLNPDILSCGGCADEVQGVLQQRGARLAELRKSPFRPFQGSAKTGCDSPPGASG